MNHIAACLRELINISVSTVLLMMAVVIFDATSQRPRHPHVWRVSFEGLLPALSYMFLMFATALFAWAFWRRRSAGNNGLVAILNVMSFILLAGAAIYDVAAN